MPEAQQKQVTTIEVMTGCCIKHKWIFTCSSVDPLAYASGTFVLGGRIVYEATLKKWRE